MEMESNMKTKYDFLEILRILTNDREAFSVEDRFRIARALSKHTRHGILYREGQMLVDIFSQDESSEVRTLAASLLRHMPNLELDRLARRMADDPCRYVRAAVEKSVEHRKRDVRRLERERKKTQLMQRKLRRLGRKLGEEHFAAVQEIIEHEQDILVGKLVHDLQGVVARIDFLASRMQGDRRDDREFARGAVDEIRANAGHLFGLADDMKSYSRARSTDTRPESVESIVREACDMAMDRAKQLHPDLAEELSITVQYSDCPSLVVARHEMVMALANLLNNALDAVADTQHEGERVVEIVAAPMPRSRIKDVRFIVRDSGVGIHPEMLEGLRVGAVGVTSKRGQGNGFGVAIARRTVEHYRGTFAIDSIDGEGTTITIEMPRKR